MTFSTRLTFSTRTLLIAGASALVLLISTYALGYYKGVSKDKPQMAVIDRQLASKQETQEKAKSVRDIMSEDDILETRLQLPEIHLPDGSRRQQVRITRTVATKEVIEATTDKRAEVKVVEKVVERRVEVPGPCPRVDALVQPFAPPPTFAPPPQPRFSLGAQAGWDLRDDRWVYGGEGGLRIAGPVWLKVAADSVPSVRAGAAVQF